MTNSPNTYSHIIAEQRKAEQRRQDRATIAIATPILALCIGTTAIAIALNPAAANLAHYIAIAWPSEIIDSIIDN